VVCPGINDGAALDDTLLGILDRFPALATVGIVPLGVSAHTTEPEMRPHTADEAKVVLDQVDAWQARALDSVGRRLAYVSDEYFLLANRPFPVADEYDGYPQHENGIGMARRFTAEVRAALRGETVDGLGARPGFFQWVEGAPAEGYRAPRTTPVAAPVSVPAPALRQTPVALITGEYGAPVLEPLADELAGVAGVPVRVVSVPNRFFGGNIAVTGLLTGADLQAALVAEPAGERYLVPDVVLSNGRFLDGLTPDALPHPIEVVPTEGAALVDALRAA
jgi:NifB/MoaA-like Fe-S oxidoreductase